MMGMSAANNITPTEKMSNTYGWIASILGAITGRMMLSAETTPQTRNSPHKIYASERRSGFVFMSLHLPESKAVPDPADNQACRD